MTRERVLIVDDEPAMRTMLGLALEGGGYSCAAAASGGEALRLLADTRYDVVLCDIRLPDISGLDLLERIKELDHHAVVIMISAYGTIETAIEAVKRGAHDYLSKPFNPREILLRMAKAREEERLREENRRLREEVEGRYSFQNIIGQSAPMRDLFEKVRKVANSKSTVLITGESGTGKELFARALHYQSRRRERPFVAVNCGAIPENLLESELFGHVKGAFTGAVGHKRGLFEEADGGTLLLDEVAELPLPLQVKLLRVLQEEEVRKVGDTRTFQVDVRVVAATSRNLPRLVAEGGFREELFYRLNVVTLAVPPLRERTEDIPLLAGHYLAAFAAADGKHVDRLTPAALQCLLSYPWPGNVRELVNVLEQAVLLTEGTVVDQADLPESVRGCPVPEPPPGREGFSLRHQRVLLERRLVTDALRESGGNRTRAARLLGISLRSLLYKIKEHGLGDDPGHA
jgi:two-component system response regulator AtoC